MQRMPNVLLAIIGYLRSYFSLSDVDNIAVDLRGFDDGLVWIKVSPSPSPGSEPVKGVVFNPSFDFNIYGPSVDVVEPLSREVMLALSKMLNYSGSDIVVTRVDVTTPYDLTDLVNGSPRYVLSATLLCRQK